MRIRGLCFEESRNLQIVRILELLLTEPIYSDAEFSHHDLTRSRISDVVTRTPRAPRAPTCSTLPWKKLMIKSFDSCCLIVWSNSTIASRLLPVRHCLSSMSSAVQRDLCAAPAMLSSYSDVCGAQPSTNTSIPEALGSANHRDLFPARN